TLDPRPDYFNSILWKRFMGTRVLDVARDGTAATDVRAYAHCAAAGAVAAAGQPTGAVALVLINLASKPRRVAIDGVPGQGATTPLLPAPGLDSPKVFANGRLLEPDAEGTPPAIVPVPVSTGAFVLPATSYAFVFLPAAHAAACR